MNSEEIFCFLLVLLNPQLLDPPPNTQPTPYDASALDRYPGGFLAPPFHPYCRHLLLIHATEGT